MIDLTHKKALFIDMDGTIVDSQAILLQTYMNFMRNMQRQGQQEEFLALSGPSLREIVTTLREVHGFSESVKDLLEHYQQLLEEVYTNKLKLFEGVVEFLAYAKEKKIQIVLVTAATAYQAKEILNNQKIAAYFDYVITPETGKGKPSPDIYLKALQTVACHADEVVAIEDSPNGVQAAVNAGIFTLHIFDAPLPSAIEQHPLVMHVKDWHSLLVQAR